VSFVHAPSLVDFITTIVGSKVFGTHNAEVIIIAFTGGHGCVRCGALDAVRPSAHQQRPMTNV
jgi:hypothetical protein